MTENKQRNCQKTTNKQKINDKKIVKKHKQMADKR